MADRDVAVLDARIKYTEWNIPNYLVVCFALMDFINPSTQRKKIINPVARRGDSLLMLPLNAFGLALRTGIGVASHFPLPDRCVERKRNVSPWNCNIITVNGERFGLGSASNCIEAASGPHEVRCCTTVVG